MRSHRDPFSIAPAALPTIVSAGVARPNVVECCILGCRKIVMYTCCIPVYSVNASSRAACRGIQLYSGIQRSTVYSSTAVYSIQRYTFPLRLSAGSMQLKHSGNTPGASHPALSTIVSAVVTKLNAVFWAVEKTRCIPAVYRYTALSPRHAPLAEVYSATAVYSGLQYTALQRSTVYSGIHSPSAAGSGFEAPGS